MSVDLWWLGADYGDDYATVVVRCTADEMVTVGCHGQEFTGNSVSAINDGVVKIAVTGLSAGQKYNYTVNGVAGGTLRTKRQSGPWWVASGSCWNNLKGCVLSRRLLADYDIDLFIALGDLPYTNTSSPEFGESTTDVTSSLANNQNQALYMAHHRQSRKINGLQELIRSTPFLYMPDDHEYPFDNGCPPDSDGGASHLLWRAGVTGAGAGTYAEFQAAWAASLAAIDAYSTGNPENTDAGIDGDAKYTRFTLGPVEVFLLDCCRYRTAYNAADGAGKTMLGAAQETWAKNKVPVSVSTWKMIVNGKQFFTGGGNTDTWSFSPGYTTERNELLWEWRNTVGLFCVAGDQHLYSDQWIAADDLGAGYPAYSCLVGCPTSVPLNTNGVTGYYAGVRKKVNGYASATTAQQDNVMALFRITETRVDRYLMSLRRGLIPCGYIEAGSNQVKYPQQRFG